MYTYDVYINPTYYWHSITINYKLIKYNQALPI